MTIKVFFYDAVYEGGKTKSMVIACDRKFGERDLYAGDSIRWMETALEEVGYRCYAPKEEEIYIFDVDLPYVGGDQIARIFNNLWAIAGKGVEIDPFPYSTIEEEAKEYDESGRGF